MNRTMAQNFSAALDEMFKLEGLGALELSLHEKYCYAPTEKILCNPAADTQSNAGKPKSTPRNSN